jgi:hypothetical protein
MAKQVLPTNFMDDILNESMNGKRRWTITQNDDGTYTLEDATTYDQLGNTFGQAQVNAMNKAINESVDQARVIDDYKTLAAVNQDGFVPGAKPVAQLISDLGGCSLEQEDGNFYIVGADSVRKKLGNTVISGTLETVAVRDRTIMTRNYIFNNTEDYTSLVLNIKNPANGGNATSATVYGTPVGTSTYEQIQKVTTLSADVTIKFKDYDHIKLAVTASHSGNVGHSYEAGAITTYAFS